MWEPKQLRTSFFVVKQAKCFPHNFTYVNTVEVDEYFSVI